MYQKTRIRTQKRQVKLMITLSFVQCGFIASLCGPSSSGLTAVLETNAGTAMVFMKCDGFVVQKFVTEPRPSRCLTAAQEITVIFF